MYETGVVYLVGSGTGNLDLITCRCKEVLERAEVLVFESSLSYEMKELIPVSCERVVVSPDGGVGIGIRSVSRILIDRAGEGKAVVRLFGGDPYHFESCVEEAKALTREGIPFEVVPGLMEGLSALTFAGIPFHSGGSANGFSVAEYPLAGGRSLKCSAYCALAIERNTLIFQTRSDLVVELSTELIAGGVAGTTPVAVIEEGGSPSQRVIESILESIPNSEVVNPPPTSCVMVVGEVSRLRMELSWFEGRPLHGRRILISRPRAQADKFSRLLKELGAETLIAPTIHIAPLDEWGALDAAILELDAYAWVIFTSVNGVRFFADRLLELEHDARSFGKGANILAIGPATARALEDNLHLKVDGVPDRYVAEGILDMLAIENLKGKRILVPRALEARAVLPEKLRKMGAEVDVVPAYRTLMAEDTDVEWIRSEISEDQVEMVTFTSSSMVQNFVEMLGEEFVGKRMKRVAVASIGPITSAKARELGLEPQVEAEVSTIPGLARAIVDFYRFSLAGD